MQGTGGKMWIEFSPVTWIIGGFKKRDVTSRQILQGGNNVVQVTLASQNQFDFVTVVFCFCGGGNLQ
ncbi:unnamed protein product [Rhizopus microsporus]